jgi:glucose/arabinose dehydrogenase
MPAALAALLVLVSACSAGAGRAGHAFSPARRDATPARIAQLKLPPGFRVDVFARDLGHPRMLHVADDGALWVTVPRAGEVVRLVPGADGTAARREVVVRDRPGVHGITMHDGALWLADVRTVWRAPLRDGAVVGALERVAALPEGGNHENRTLAFDRDGWLYVTVGSTCNACVEDDPEHATILRMRPDGSERAVFARGLRNTIGFGWHPATGELWGMDHGVDWRGDEEPREELNRIVQGGDYGWPYAYNDRRRDPEMWPRLPADDRPRLGDRTPEAWLAATEVPALGYTAHAAPIGMVFYTGTQFPAEYRNDAFVAFRGSWNREPPSGYEVVRVRFGGGKPVRFEPFLTGFLVDSGQAQFARLAGIGVAKDGALLVADDENGVIYRVRWTG